MPMPFSATQRQVRDVPEYRLHPLQDEADGLSQHMSKPSYRMMRMALQADLSHHGNPWNC